MGNRFLGMHGTRADSSAIWGPMHGKAPRCQHHKRRLVTLGARLHFKRSRRITQDLTGQGLTQDRKQDWFVVPHLLEQIRMLTHHRRWPDPQAILTLKHEPKANIRERLTER